MWRCLLPLLITAAGAVAAAADGIRIDDGEVRAATPAARAVAVYMRLVNESGRDDRLVDVRADGAAGAALHASVEDGGTMRMNPAPEGFAIPAGGELVLEPGGRHIMIFAPSGPVEDGAGLDLELDFEAAGTVRVTLPLRIGPAAQAHGG